jgi:PilZ domain
MHFATQTFLGSDHIPWEWIVPCSAGLVAAGTAFVLSRFVFARPAATPVPTPTEKPTAEYDPFVQGSATEQRGAFRRGGNRVKILVNNPQKKGDALEAWVLDRSVGGLCLAVKEAVAEGSVLEIRAANAPPATPWVEVQIKTCRQTKEDWEVGCQFVKTPPWAVMLLFG